MKQEQFQWSVIGGLFLLLIALGLLLVRQQIYLERISHFTTISQEATGRSQNEEETRVSPSSSTTPSSQPAQGGVVARLMAFESSSLQTSSRVQFIQRCTEGTVQTKQSDFDGKTHSFCVGTNTLSVLDNGGETVIDERTVREPQDAPILYQIIPVANVTATSVQQVLVAYDVEPCTTSGDCGLGMTAPAVRYAYTLGSHVAQPIAHYPLFIEKYESGVWNPDRTKVVFYPDTCGGAGCYPASLSGYDLKRDLYTETVTSEKALTLPDNAAQVGAGDVAEPSWGEIQWLTNSTFRASILSPGAPKRWVNGQL